MATRRAIPPRQARSRETYERIVVAVEGMLAERRFEDVTLQDICVAAEVSSSSLYARFPSKDSIMGALVERQQELLRARMADTLGTLAGTELDAWGLAAELLGTYLEWTRTRQPVIDAIRADPQGAVRMHALVEESLRNLTALIAGQLGATDAYLVRRIELALRVLTMALSMSASEGMVGIGERMGMSDAELVQELTRMAGAYFDADADPRAAP